MMPSVCKESFRTQTIHHTRHVHTTKHSLQFALCKPRLLEAGFRTLHYM